MKISVIGGAGVRAPLLIGSFAKRARDIDLDEIALYDIDATRLKESKSMLETLNTNINGGRAKISAHLGVKGRKAALKGAAAGRLMVVGIAPRRDNISDIAGSLKERQKAKEIVELQKILDAQEAPAAKRGDVSRNSLNALSAVKASEKITEKPLDSVRELPAEKRSPAPEMTIRKPRTVETNDMVREVKKSALEISGPLKQRKIISSSAPAYPEWAKRKGVEADLVLKFYVNPQGRVLPDISVVRTSGYRELDVLAMEALKKWMFAPLANNEPQQDQWGAVTIRYILE